MAGILEPIHGGFGVPVSIDSRMYESNALAMFPHNQAENAK